MFQGKRIGLKSIHGNSESKTRLFCFHHAGGGAASFHSWASHLSDDIELIAVQLAGREDLISAPLFEDTNSAVQGIVQSLMPLLDKQYCFFGHSLGALLSFETARLIQKLSLRTPDLLLLSGRRAAHIPLHREPYHCLPDKEFVEIVAALNGTPAAVLENKELMSYLIPCLRADFKLNETYRYVHGEALDAPLVVLAGVDDEVTKGTEVNSWQRLTNKKIDLKLFPGGHFFVDDARNQVLEFINSKIGQYLGP